MAGGSVLDVPGFVSVGVCVVRAGVPSHPVDTNQAVRVVDTDKSRNTLYVSACVYI